VTYVPEALHYGMCEPNLFLPPPASFFSINPDRQTDRQTETVYRSSRRHSCEYRVADGYTPVLATLLASVITTTHHTFTLHYITTISSCSPTQ